MREVLLNRLQKLTEHFAQALVGLVEDRIEADLAHIGEVLEYSLSAIASDLNAPPDEPDVFTEALGPELAEMLTPKPKPPQPAKRIVHRDIKPENVPKRVPTPPNSNARSCGCAARGPHRRDCGTSIPQPFKSGFVSHPTVSVKPVATTIAPKSAPRRLQPKPDALEAAAKARREAIIARAEERWSPNRITAETELAEGSKREGALPTPRSSFHVERAPRKGELGEVTEFGGAE
jgi:hypothetical protein